MCALTNTELDKLFVAKFDVYHQPDINQYKEEVMEWQNMQ